MSDRFYTVEILNEPISFGTISYLNSVKLSEYAAQKKIGEHKLGYLTKEDIYFKIDRGQHINIDQAYIKDFSLTDYRATRNLAVNEKVTIAGISSCFAFFDCDASIDFSYAIFKDEVNFERVFFHTARSVFTMLNSRPRVLIFQSADFIRIKQPLSTLLSMAQK
ncbi:MAG: hypothetical protein IPG07_10375 [Crocinitomicaceae bacterium]|nr:hypothetical protein [Crocinitomicaceae bacterium]